ncbi:hypothetical protein LshimejAT787_0102940 [Lyophyllum shimeji]|uniref:RBR-type E3 ubiquitin transferase n=1 Tax=Lyophyllum shimeji TaxID=47721 RepID=A0A9P3PCD3_LYOSH|nr:hypothetical protein LshimejAT787_0102940 [Lyophyllum shimeji]
MLSELSQDNDPRSNVLVALKFAGTSSQADVVTAMNANLQEQKLEETGADVGGSRGVQVEEPRATGSSERVRGNDEAVGRTTNRLIIKPNSSMSQSQSVSASNDNKPCYAWKAGKCVRGARCLYSHDQSVVRRPLLVKGTAPKNASGAAKPAALTKPAAGRSSAHLAEQEAARVREVERSETERKDRGTEMEATRVVQEAERLAAVQKARAEAEAAWKRKAEEKKAERLAREAERERVRQAAVEAARIQEARRLQAEEEAARRREARAREEAARQALLAEQEALRIEREAAVTTQHIVLGSTLVTCGAGLEVQGVVSGFESCRLTIHNLPSDATASEVADLFTQQGMSPHDIHILSIKPTPGHRREAKVLTSAVQGGAIAVGLDGIEFRSETLRFEVSENASVNAMGESGRSADTLTITWTAPSVSMVATYSNMDDARAKAKALDRRILGGRRIRAEMNSPPVGPALRYYNPSSVKIYGLPVDISMDTIMDLAETPSVRSIKSNAYQLDEFMTALREHLAQLPDGGMKTFNVDSGRTEDGMIKVTVLFESWDHAQRARASLEGRRLRPNSPYFRLSLPQPHHFVSTIPTQQYDAQKGLWDSLAQAKDDKGPRIHVHRVPDRGIVRIRLSGEDKKAVGALKVRVETLVAGEKLDTTYWHRSFLWPKGRAFLDKVFQETGVYVRGDFKVQALKLYGEGRAVNNARQMIEEEVARLAQLEWTVTLRRQTVGYFVRKGLAALKEVLSEDAVTLDLRSTPCKLTIRGGEEARHALKTLMDQSMTELDLNASGTGEDICPICYDTVSHPVKLGCKHVYCTACIRHYLTSAAESKIFPVACMGNEAHCKILLSIPLIQRFLLPQQYEHLVNVAFSTYLDHHPRDFKYCTTPDCTQIYRANTKTMLKCPSCFAEVCSSCHEEAHEGMTCEERRARKTQEEEQLNEYWAMTHGAKRCPSCRVWIEKTEGCNHMTCRCGAHVCWICLREFPANQIYAHLGDVHGGLYDEDRERQNNDLQHALALQRQFEQQGNANRFGAVQPPVQPARRPDWRGEPVELLRAEYRRLAAQRQQEAAEAEAEAERLRRDAALRRQVLERQRQEYQRQREEYQRQFEERQAQVIREAQERRRREGGWGCTIM